VLSSSGCRSSGVWRPRNRSCAERSVHLPCALGLACSPQKRSMEWTLPELGEARESATGCRRCGNFANRAICIPAVTSGTEFFVVTLSVMSGQPSCTGPSPRLALSTADPRYKTIVSNLLGAYFSGASIYANGAGTCNTYPGGAEDLAYVCLDGGIPC
jgi:hypothetical protein